MGEEPKPWGIRNIIYASGLFSVALTVDRTRDAKINLLEDLFSLPVLDRMVEICGETNVVDIFSSYNYFLEKLERSDVRSKLAEIGKNERLDPLFRELKNEGHHFTRELLKLFEATFDSTHPIRKAVIF